MQFEISSSYQPTGDQPEAIKQLTENLKKGISHQTLLDRGKRLQLLM